MTLTVSAFVTGAAAVWQLFVAFVLMLGVAYLIARAWDARPRRRRYLFESDLMQPWSDRAPGDLRRDR